MFDLFKKSRKTTVTAVNIKMQGQTHTLEGVESGGETIALKIPFRNKTHADMLTEAKVFKTEKPRPLNIEAIKVAGPFSLVSIEPRVPVEIKPDELVNFMVTIGVPKHNYTGPVNISFEPASEGTIRIEITKTVLDYRGKKTEMEHSSRVLALHKNGIFVEKVQMLKAVPFGGAVRAAEAAFPFRLVNTEPKLPAELNTPNGYMMSFCIQAPDHQYSGALMIRVS
jgi:hypothetical protein